MKKLFITISLLFSIGFMLAGQASDSFISSCVMNAGKDAKYLKDFRIELGKAPSEQADLRYKANISLWKNTKYRFTVCTENSNGELYISLKDDTNKVVLTSYDKQTGKTYQFIDFVCNKSGIYQLNYDFTNGEQGSGVGVISMVK